MSPASAACGSDSGAASTRGRARASSSGPGRSGSGARGRSSDARPKSATTEAPTTDARRKRGTSACTAKTRRVSREYSTWRKAKVPTQIEAATVAAAARSQGALSGSSSRELRR